MSIKHYGRAHTLFNYPRYCTLVMFSLDCFLAAMHAVIVAIVLSFPGEKAHGYSVGKDDDFKNLFFKPIETLQPDRLNRINYKVSFEKIVRMHKNALENGFTSYAEA